MKQHARKLGISLLVVGIATWLQLLVGLDMSGSPFLLFFPAVLIASLYGMGLVVVFFSAASAEFFFVPPYGSAALAWPEGWVRLGLFLASSLTIHYIATRLRKTELDLRVKTDARKQPQCLRHRERRRQVPLRK